MYISKRELLAQICFGTGLLWLLEHARRRRLLIVLNYHRVGNPCDTPFDRGTFSASGASFDEQVAYLTRHFHLCTLEEALSMVAGKAPFRTSVLITFDDGYVDHYQLAFPILRSHGVQAVFFVPTAFIGTGRLPWWDNVAYTIRNSQKNILKLAYQNTVINVSRDGVENAIAGALELYKQLDTTTDQECFLRDLRAASEVDLGSPSTPLFLNWSQVREMQAAGMAFGSHTHSHAILAKLTPNKQADELLHSRLILERELAAAVHVLAYPNGLPNSFDNHTFEVLRDNAYDAAFSFYGGFNFGTKTHPFDIRRVRVGNPSRARFRLQLSHGAITGHSWI